MKTILFLILIIQQGNCVFFGNEFFTYGAIFKNIVNTLNFAAPQLIIPDVGEDGYLNTVQLAEKYGYRCEEHFLVTSDGYILLIHRLNGRINGSEVSRSAPTVLLMHGILGASTHMILNGEKSPAGILSDCGFDVWIGNNRGTRYSRNHTSLNPENLEFWKFTFNELILIDYAAFVDYILKYVNKFYLHYVGYSQGGLLMAGLLSQKPEYNSKVKSLSFIASSLVLKGFQSNSLDLLIKTAKPFERNVDAFSNPFEIGPYNKLKVNFAYRFCNKGSIFFNTCFSLYTEIFGQDNGKIDLDRLAVYMAHLSNGISSNQLLHLAQAYKVDNITLFDFGPEINKQFYGEKVPAANFSLVTAPKLFIYGSDDRIITKESILATIPLVKNVTQVIKVKGFNHFHFLFSGEIKEKVYNAVARHIKYNQWLEEMKC